LQIDGRARIAAGATDAVIYLWNLNQRQLAFAGAWIGKADELGRADELDQQRFRPPVS
jgi:hypothetical protein